MTDLVLTTYDWVPDAPRGYVRDLRVRVQESEVKAHKWASLAEARQLITYAQSRNLFDEVIKYLAL